MTTTTIARIISASLVAATLTSACTHRGVDQKAFESLHRAVVTTRSAVSVGVSYPQFAELLASLQTEAQLAAAAAKTDQERALLKDVDDALEVYRNSLAVWRIKVETGRTNLKDDVAIQLAKQYGVPRVPNYLTEVYPADDIIQALWDEARKSLAAAESAYLGPPS